MPREYIYEPWTAPLSVQTKAKCIVGKDYPKQGIYCRSSCLTDGGSALCNGVFLGFKKVYCPFKDCAGMIINEGGNVIKESVCPYCRRLFCAQCKVVVVSFEFLLSEFQERMAGSLLVVKSQLERMAGGDVLCLRSSFSATAFGFRAYFSSVADIGQPTPASHTQLMSKGEITPGISTDEYLSSRKKLLDILPENSLANYWSSTCKMMTDVVPYTHRQDADYLYITGCQ
ncbi:hypothetical protein ACFE04_010059 [Oxalis oulophora]